MPAERVPDDSREMVGADQAAMIRTGANATTYRFPLGNFMATVVSDGTLHWAPYLPQLASNATATQFAAALDAHCLPTGHVTLNCNHLILDDGRQRILIDTGNGPTRGPRTGHLVANLAAVGYDAADITDVVLTHAHPDHIWGTVHADGSLAFMNARHHISRAEWSFWTAPEVRLEGVQMPKPVRDGITVGAKRALASLAGRVTLFELGDEVLRGVRSLNAPGHTPGHSPLLIRAENRQLLVAADVAYLPGPSLEHPDWHPALDADPKLAERSRRAVLSLAAEERLLMLGFHFPFPGLGHVVAKRRGFHWEPSPWEWAD